MLRIHCAPPERTIYIHQCYNLLLEKLGAVVFWDKSYHDIPGGMPRVMFWLTRRFAKCYAHPCNESPCFFIFTRWRGYNRGRHRNMVLHNSRWY